VALRGHPLFRRSLWVSKSAILPINPPARPFPNGVLAQLLEKGCELLSNEAGVASLKAGLAGISPDPAERRAQVDEAVKQVLRSGLPQDFTGQGAPRVSAVQPLLPFHVTREEVLQSFDDIAADDQSQRHS